MESITTITDAIIKTVTSDDQIKENLAEAAEFMADFFNEKLRPCRQYNVTLRRIVSDFKGEGNIGYWLCEFVFKGEEEIRTKGTSRFLRVTGIGKTPNQAMEAFDLAMDEPFGYHSFLSKTELGKAAKNYGGN